MMMNKIQNKYLFIFSVFILGTILTATNPDYKQHQIKVEEFCQAKSSQDQVSLCPLGYDKINVANFDEKSFSVYSVGILSYSTYQEKISTVGILGNIFTFSDQVQG